MLSSDFIAIISFKAETRKCPETTARIYLAGIV
jgi:hypothetical protein